MLKTAFGELRWERGAQRMQEVVKPAAEGVQRQPRELYCPRCGLRLELLSRSTADYAVSYSVATWAERCTQSEIDSPLVCLMRAAGDRDIF
jgi:uncharacterized protein with PIN domain